MGRPRINMEGGQFGRLFVIGYSHSANKTSYWRCQCKCGEVIITHRSSLISGNTKSCGCYAREESSRVHFKHGKCASKTYHCWESMLGRVKGQKHKHLYFDLGVKADPRWYVFNNFLEDMGEIPSDKDSLDRVDPSGNYCKANCRWATHREQANNKRATIKYTFLNQTCSIPEWARRLSVNKSVLIDRLKNGWDIRRVLTEHIG